MEIWRFPKDGFTMVHLKPFNDRISTKLENLNLNDKKQIVGIDDNIVYGYLDEYNDIYFYSKKNGKTEYVKNPTVGTITLSNGVVTVKFVSGKKDLVFSKGKPIKTVQEIPETPTNNDDLEQDIEPESQNFENGSIPEMADFEKINPKITDFQSKLGVGLTLDKDEFEQYQLRDLNQNGYGFVPRNLETIWFWNRNNNPKYELKPRLHTISKIDLSENQTVLVSFTDGTKAEYYPQTPIKETPKKAEPKQDLFEIQDDSSIPIYDGTSTSVEECIRFLFTDELLKECLYTNILDGRIYLNSKLLGKNPPKIEPYNANWELTTIQQMLEQKFAYVDKGVLKRPKFTKMSVDDVLIKLGSQNVINPFLDRIRNTEYQGLMTIKTYLRDIGVTTRLSDPEKSELYLESVSCALFLAIIERQLHMDGNRPIRFVPIMIGEQSTGKSTMCRKLALDSTSLFKESTRSIDDLQKYLEQIIGSVISEIAEGTQFILGKQDSYKAYFDMNVIQYRKPYDREITERPKQYFEIITTNNNEILTDVTGNTRYYPLFLDGLEKPTIPVYDFTVDEMLQLYADALIRYENGERWHTYLENPEIQKIADSVRANVTQEINGLNEIINLANTEYSEIGSFLPNDAIREYLRNDPYYFDDKIIEKAKRNWGRCYNKYGFRKEFTNIKDEFGKWHSSRGYRRIRMIDQT